MEKIKLNLQELRVSSFETAKSGSYKGTVKGLLPDTYVCSRFGEESCHATCPSDYATCGHTCSPEDTCLSTENNC